MLELYFAAHPWQKRIASWILGAAFAACWVVVLLGLTGCETVRPLPGLPLDLQQAVDELKSERRL